MFPRLSHSLSPSPGTLQVGGGFRHQGSDYLCQQCWSVLCSQPWPAEQAAPGAGGTAACSPVQLGGGAQRAAPPAAGQNGALGLPPTAPLPLPHQPAFGSHPGHPGVLSAAAAAASHAALQRRCQSVADLQLALAGGRPARPSGWQPASMPEAPAILGSADDPRWGALAMAASAPDYHRTRSGAQRSQQMAVSGSAPVFSPLELKNMMDESSLEIFESQSHLLDPETRLQLQVGGGGGWVGGWVGGGAGGGGRTDRRAAVGVPAAGCGNIHGSLADLVAREVQPVAPVPPTRCLPYTVPWRAAQRETSQGTSHMQCARPPPDPLLQKQRQYLEWQNSMEESGPMRASLERTDSAGSGSGAPDVASLRQVRAAGAPLAGVDAHGGAAAGREAGGLSCLGAGCWGQGSRQAASLLLLPKTGAHRAVQTTDQHALLAPPYCCRSRSRRCGRSGRALVSV